MKVDMQLNKETKLSISVCQYLSIYLSLQITIIDMSWKLKYLSFLKTYVFEERQVKRDK